MGFMTGPSPIRRTLNYLNAGKLNFRKKVKIFTINYNTQLKALEHKGAKEFVFWYLPQVQYKNPDVQIVTLKNMSPTPYIQCYFDKGDKMVIDIFNKTKEEIMAHLIKVVGKTEEILQMEAQKKKDNPANFGYKCERHCICEIPGQIPCPRIVPLPNHLRGKFNFPVKI